MAKRAIDLTKTNKILPENQSRAAVLLASGVGESAVGDAVGVTRQTVWEWKQQTEFQAALNRERAAIRQAWQDEAQGLNSQALSVVRAALEGEDRALAFRAACFLLAKSGLLSGALPEIGPTSSSMIALTQWGF